MWKTDLSVAGEIEFAARRLRPLFPRLDRRPRLPHQDRVPGQGGVDDLASKRMAVSPSSTAGTRRISAAKVCWEVRAIKVRSRATMRPCGVEAM